MVQDEATWSTKGNVESMTSSHSLTHPLHLSLFGLFRMKIAIEGCCHGELDKIYETISCLEKKEGVTVDLLLCCGDFQAVRNEGDLKCMAVPAKYRTMQTFYKSVC